MADTDNKNTNDVVVEEFLTTEETEAVVKQLQALKIKKIYLKEFIGNDGNLVSYLYIPMSIDSSLHQLKVPFGSLRVKEYTVTKVTKLGLSLADSGKEVTDFETSDIAYNA